MEHTITSLEQVPAGINLLFEQLASLKQIMESKPIKESQPISETYLTRQEVAKILKISLPTLNELTKSGQLPSYRIASNIRYKASDIEQSLINNTPKTGRK
jgi:excisionase family DNA binding protein